MTKARNALLSFVIIKTDKIKIDNNDPELIWRITILKVKLLFGFVH